MTMIRSRTNGLIISGSTEAARDVLRTNAGTLAEMMGGKRPVPAAPPDPPPAEDNDAGVVDLTEVSSEASSAAPASVAESGSAVGWDKPHQLPPDSKGSLLDNEGQNDQPPQEEGGSAARPTPRGKKKPPEAVEEL